MSELRSVVERADRAVSRVPLPADGLQSFIRRRDRKRRRQRITAGIVGAAVFLAVVWLVTGGPFVQTPTRTVPRGEDREPQVPEPTIAPSDPDRQIALPPAGATPSSPERGELVMTYYGRPSFGVLQVLVYADGRVILREEYGPKGANGIRTGFLEQRLTPEGVELLHSEITSSGLFDRDHDFDDGRNVPGGDEHGLIWGEIRVDDGDGFVSVGWGPLGARPTSEPATSGQATALKRLNDLFSDLSSSLPASAWQDLAVRAYVPSRYAICYRKAWSQHPEDVILPSKVLSVLPTPAADLLRGKARTYQPNPNGEGRREVCSVVSTQEARFLAEILVDAGSERVWTGLTTGAPEYTMPAPPPIDRAFIRFEPILPHGQWSLFPG